MYTLEQLRTWQAFIQSDNAKGTTAHKDFLNVLMREFGCSHSEACKILDSLLELSYK